jgi:hypothetical protein
VNPYFPFHVIGFKCNPFRTLTDDEWSEIAILPESILEAADASTHLQILGALGRGKTTTLMGLQAHLKRAGKRVAYEYIPEGQTRFYTPLDDLEIFLLDEAQRIKNFPKVLNLREVRLIFTSHQDFASHFAHYNLSLIAIELDTMTPDHLRRVIEKRLTYFALDDQPQTRFADDAIEYLYEKFGSDLRGAERFLYEVFQSRVATGMIGVDQLRNFHLLGANTNGSD